MSLNTAQYGDLVAVFNDPGVQTYKVKYCDRTSIVVGWANLTVNYVCAIANDFVDTDLISFILFTG